MAEQPGRDWTAMTRADFDPDVPLQLAVPTGPAAIPAEPDECGTAPLFGEESPVRRAPRTARRRAVRIDQDGLF
ncbi:hypothetical protein [Streptomyces sp. NPDC096193]|uniref:hypothetical protein n=1 Tax=Streptomyces sp. NPDC096193 TaxID=3155821 RepID=UPI0033326564